MVTHFVSQYVVPDGQQQLERFQSWGFSTPCVSVELFMWLRYCHRGHVVWHFPPGSCCSTRLHEIGFQTHDLQSSVALQHCGNSLEKKLAIKKSNIGQQYEAVAMAISLSWKGTTSGSPAACFSCCCQTMMQLWNLDSFECDKTALLDPPNGLVERYCGLH